MHPTLGFLALVLFSAIPLFCLVAPVSWGVGMAGVLVLVLSVVDREAWLSDRVLLLSCLLPPSTGSVVRRAELPQCWP